MAIVDRCNAGDYPGFVVQDGFDDMRRDLQDSHVGCNGAADIVKAPILCLQPDEGIEPILKATETRDRCLAGRGKHVVGAEEARDRAENVERLPRQRDDVSRAVFRAIGFERECPTMEVQFRPAHGRYFLATLPGEQEKLAELFEGIAFGLASLPIGDDFVIGQNTVTRLLLDRRLKTDHGRVFDNALIDAPGIELLDCGQPTVRPRAFASLRADIADQALKFAGHVATLDGIDWHGVKTAHALQNALGALPVLGLALGVSRDELMYDIAQRQNRRRWLTVARLECAQLNVAQYRLCPFASILERQHRVGPQLDASQYAINASGEIPDLSACSRDADMQAGDKLVTNLVPLTLSGGETIKQLGCQFLSHDATIRLQRPRVRVWFGTRRDITEPI